LKNQATKNVASLIFLKSNCSHAVIDKNCKFLTFLERAIKIHRRWAIAATLFDLSKPLHSTTLCRLQIAADCIQRNSTTWNETNAIWISCVILF